jgi:hypothetical protein
MFDEFFFRRRKNNGIFYMMIGFIVLGVAMMAAGVYFIL